MARELLAQGRAADVARMIEPLLEPLPPDDASGTLDPGHVLLRCLMARVQLLEQGRAGRAIELLQPFEQAGRRARLEPPLRAEVALWLGWAHAWHDTSTHDDARALHLLDEAAARFDDGFDISGRCWTQLGRAQVYFTIDEYPLMQQALKEATLLQKELADVQASRWIHELSITAARFAGRYYQAQAHLDALAAEAASAPDPLLAGKVAAYQAALRHDQGRSPASIINAAEEAEALLTGASVQPGYPLLLAYRKNLSALLRSGAWDRINPLTEQAMQRAGRLPAASAYLLLPRAQLDLRRGHLEAAQETLEHVHARLHRIQHRLLLISLSLVYSAFYERNAAFDQATKWAERAYRTATETGHRVQQLQAQLALARLHLGQGKLLAVKHFLNESESHSNLFGHLPLAAQRFDLLGRYTNATERPDEARAFFAQALSAYSMMQDRHETARLQLQLGRLGRDTDPAWTRPLLEAAEQTFGRLGVTPALEETRALLASWPADTPSDAAGAPELGHELARSALSVELVAEAWLQAAERLLPDASWLAVYRYASEGVWQLIHQHGTPPTDPGLPEEVEPAEQQVAATRWLRLRGPTSPAFFFGTILNGTDPAATWSTACTHLKPWLPVAELALNHALLHAQGPISQDGFPGEAEAALPDTITPAGPSIRRIIGQIRRLRSTHSPVLITGEAGTDKPLVARAIHDPSAGPFITLDCAEVSHEHLASHLFGQEGGEPGSIRRAEGGTLFLQAIDRLPHDVQPMLLRVLQEGEVLPLGARRPVAVNVRLIASTRVNLEQRIRSGHFHEALYYRLNTIPLHLPALRERREEIPLLVRHYLDELRPPGMPMVSITPHALDLLLRYDWPGNMRQLRNELERALLQVRNEPAPTIDVKDLAAPIVEAAQLGARSVPSPVQQLLHGRYTLDEVLARTEKTLVEQVLAAHDGQVSAAAEALGLTRQGLYKKMKRLEIDTARFQARDTLTE